MPAQRGCLFALPGALEQGVDVVPQRAADYRCQHSRGRRIKTMSQTKQERNKARVLVAFDTLFNKRDYVAAERYWSPTYIQHSAHIARGREGLFNLIKSMPPTLKYEPGVIVADGDFVIIHGRFSGFGAPVNTRRLKSIPRAAGRCSATLFRNNAGPDEAPFVIQL